RGTMADTSLVGRLRCCLLSLCLCGFSAPGMPAKRGTRIAGLCGGLPGALLRWVWPAGARRAAGDAASPRAARHRGRASRLLAGCGG
ncbi:unnamed protein product, partial [Effrenium voratum]